MSDPVDVLIADDHPVYRSGLRAVLDGIARVRVIGEACTGTEALTMTCQLRPRLVLMDVNLPRLNGIEATRTITRKCRDTSVIIVTGHEDRETFLAAIRAGARGYLLKGASTQDVNRAIDVVCSGSLLFDPQVSSWVVEHLTKPPACEKPFPELTDRERAVLELIADGQANAAIARELGLSVKTVRNYLSRILTKLRLCDRTEAAVRARRAGLGH